MNRAISPRHKSGLGHVLGTKRRSGQPWGDTPKKVAAEGPQPSALTGWETPCLPGGGHLGGSATANRTALFRHQHASESSEGGLPGLANKNRGHSGKFEFQIIKYFLRISVQHCRGHSYIKNYSLFVKHIQIYLGMLYFVSPLEGLSESRLSQIPEIRDEVCAYALL